MADSFLYRPLPLTLENFLSLKGSRMSGTWQHHGGAHQRWGGVMRRRPSWDGHELSASFIPVTAARSLIMAFSGDALTSARPSAVGADGATELRGVGARQIAPSMRGDTDAGG
jgi:hypothetical protein